MLRARGRLLAGRAVTAHAHVDAHFPEPRHAVEQDAIRLVVSGELLGVREHDLLVGVGLDREDARGELVARILFEQRGILFPVQEVLVDLLRAAALDDLALLQLASDAHREARDRGLLGQRDLEAPFTPARLGVPEPELQLRERERIFDHGARLERHELQARAVGCGERDRRTLGVLRALAPGDRGRGRPALCDLQRLLDRLLGTPRGQQHHRPDTCQQGSLPHVRSCLDRVLRDQDAKTASSKASHQDHQRSETREPAVRSVGALVVVLASRCCAPLQCRPCSWSAATS